MRRMKRLCTCAILLFIFCLFPASFAEEESFTAQCVCENRLSMIKRGNFSLLGMLELSHEADYIEALIYDERKACVEYSRKLYPQGGQTSFALSEAVRPSAFSKLSPGEKTLKVVCTRGAAEICALEIHFSVLGEVHSLREITRDCTFDTVQNESYLYNGSYYPKYSWRASEEEDTLTVHFPENENVSYVTVEWYAPPKAEGFVFEAFNASGECVYSETADEGYRMYADTFPTDETVRSIRIRLTDHETAINALHVFSENGPVREIQNWQPMPEKLDILHISTHQDDELLFFGGSIPYHAALGYETGVLYMVDCGRERFAEALSGLWVAGLKTHPVFLDFMDSVPDSYEQALTQWGGMEHTVQQLVREIRRYKPEVIVTHGEDGEYGHQHHIVTSNAVYLACLYASNPEMFPESYAQYGAWQVKKLYRHQSFGENVINMNWDTPMDALDGRTPLEMSEIAYHRHLSQISYLAYSFADKYDSSSFALVYSTVGADTVGGDFFENLVP